ncbi:MAG: ABC transporter ATP-binding protein [Rhodospirillales bacterium]|nr:ABC transporter ATP-binding protein [Rhodospirillales bacterium]MDP7241359.1 ABC transporter ATP-binding protein [Rhodospirillales bacterium]
MTVLAIKDLHAGYGKSEVLHGVSLSIARGEIVALIGANGAGKTTLLKTISGLVRLTQGSIELEDTNIARRAAHKIVHMGVSQVAEGRAILKRMTVLENLRMGAFVRSDPDIDRDIQEKFERFPALGERRDRLAITLSGGEQQMLAIARALMAKPRLLLLDEPSLGLAPMVVTQIFRTLRDLKTEGKTIFLVEQNARQALRIADKGYVLERGKIVMEDTGDSLLDDPEVQRTYLGKHAT